ncbi:Hypothetical protein GLP15_4807 [Giardia lamblia P15]|uniref:Uncharacterized protein n=1 Tax=Giardia intestinalis (strain P15) TaxID=658858 RepID=E1F9Q8_GIAIA|nr:Hypothetical protein GLP15_4807 [Giardia lamblia P15]
MPNSGPSQQYLWFRTLYKTGSILGALALLALCFMWISVKLVSFRGANNACGLGHGRRTQKLDTWVICISLISNSFMWILRPIVRSATNKPTHVAVLISLLVVKLLGCFLIIGMFAFYCVVVRELELDIQLNAICMLIGLLILALALILASASLLFAIRYLRIILGGYWILSSDSGNKHSNWSKVWQHIRTHPYPIVICLNILSVFCFSIIFSTVFANRLPFYYVVSTLLNNKGTAGIIVSTGGYMPYAPANSLLGLSIASDILDTSFTLDCALIGDLSLVATSCYDISKCVSSDSLEAVLEEGRRRNYGFSGMVSPYDILTFSSSQITSLNVGSKYLELDPFGHITPFLIATPDKTYASEIIRVESAYIESLKAQNVSLLIDTLLLGLSTTPYTLIRLRDRPDVVYFSNHSEHGFQADKTDLSLPYAYILGVSFVNLIHTLSTTATSQLDSCGVLIDSPITFQKVASYIDLSHPHMKMLVPAKCIVDGSLSTALVTDSVKKVTINGVYCTFHSMSYCVRASSTISNNSSFEIHFLHANSFLMMTAAVLLNAQYIHTEFYAAYGPDASFIISSILFFNLKIGLILYICIYYFFLVASLTIMCYSEVLLKH